jgi:hypothetical protein
MASVDVSAFSPWAGLSTSLAVSVTSATTLYYSSSGPRPQKVRVTSVGGNSLINFVGTSSGVAASPTAMLLMSGISEVLTSSGPYIAAITTTGTATLFITPGEGGG